MRLECATIVFRRAYIDILLRSYNQSYGFTRLLERILYYIIYYIYILYYSNPIIPAIFQDNSIISFDNHCTIVYVVVSMYQISNTMNIDCINQIDIAYILNIPNCNQKIRLSR